jgi:hypothetical protein
MIPGQRHNSQKCAYPGSKYIYRAYSIIFVKVNASQNVTFLNFLYYFLPISTGININAYSPARALTSNIIYRIV